MVRTGDTPPLELFAQGIRAKETRIRYTRTLRQITCVFLEEMLTGSFEERVEQMVRHGRDEPEWARDLMISLVRKLRKRTELAQDDPDYLNPASLGNYFKPLKKLLDMNDVSLNWDRVYATYPELDNMPDTAGWSRGDIARILRQARDHMDRVLVLVLASSGVRAGALNVLSWRDLTPIYRAGGRLTLDPGEEGGVVACAALTVYRGSTERYTTFITPEAFAAIREYGRSWSECMGRQARPEDPMFLATQGVPRRLTHGAIRHRLEQMVKKSGLRDEGRPGKRFNVPLTNGFRRFFNKTTKDAPTHDTPGALIRSEYMMGHKGLTSLDQNYFKTTVLELAAGYVNVVPDLTIDDADRLRLSNKRMADNLRKAEGEKDEKMARMEKEMARMEKEMARMEKEMGELRRNRGLPGSDLVGALKEAAEAEGVPGPIVESLAGMMRQLGAVQEATLKEIRDENDAKMDRVLSVIEKAVKEGDLKHNLLAEFKKAAAAKDEPPGTNPLPRDPRDSGLC